MAIYIGGDTQELEFDFFTKVAGSTTECPMKLYYSITANPSEPVDNITDDILTGWKAFDNYENGQQLYDMIKNQDSLVIPNATSVPGVLGQYVKLMVELDLTPICNVLYGGSNSALKSALKSIKADIYAMGSGSNVGQLGYGVNFGLFHVLNNAFEEWWSSNNSPSVNKLSNSTLNSSFYVTSANKIYILVRSTYKSDGAIPSKVNLDYVNIKVNLARVSDVIAPIPIELGDTWSMLIKGFSPSFDSSLVQQTTKSILTLSQDNINNHFGYSPSLKAFFFWNSAFNINLIEGNAENFNKHQSYNILIEQVSTGYTLRILKNNGSIVKTVSNTNRLNKGLYSLFLGRYPNADVFQADAFLENIYFFNNKIFTDEEAEAMLRGTKEGFENPNLVQKLSTFYSAGAIIEISTDNKLVISNPSTIEKFIYSPKFQLLPNNRYELTIDCDIVGSCEVFVLNNKSQYGLGVMDGQQLSNGVNKFSFVTTDKNCPVDSQFIRLDVNDSGSRLTLHKVELRRLD